MEARWQQVYELERSKADALTIEGLQNDLNALIQDKQGLSEELLKLRATLAGIPQPKRDLAERVAELEQQVVRMEKERVRAEEQTASAFNSVIKGLEDEVQSVTKQRDEAQRKLVVLERKFTRRQSTLVSLKAAGASAGNLLGAHVAHAAPAAAEPPQDAEIRRDVGAFGADGASNASPTKQPTSRASGGATRKVDLTSSSSSGASAPRQVVRGLRRAPLV